MNSILNYTRDQIQEFIDMGSMRPESLKHYDLCKAMSSGMTGAQASDKFDYTDPRYVRRIKSQKCPDCSKKIG
jgi:hypothetical protein